MVVGVVSDTHGNQAGIRRVAEHFRALGVEVVLHLGDDYRDLAALQKENFRVLGVPGLYCPEYLDPKIPNRQVVELAGIKFLLGHTEQRHRLDPPSDPDPQNLVPDVKVVLYGHTHIPAMTENHGTIWINPGHLKDRVDKGFPPTFALLRLQPDAIEVSIQRLDDGETMMHQVFPV